MNKVGVDQLDDLTPEHLKELIPAIGDRIRLKAKIDVRPQFSKQNFVDFEFINLYVTLRYDEASYEL